MNNDEKESLIVENNFGVIGEDNPPPNFQFIIDDQEILRLEKDKFFYKGQEYSDPEKLYEFMCFWMKLADNNL